MPATTTAALAPRQEGSSMSTSDARQAIQLILAVTAIRSTSIVLAYLQFWMIQNQEQVRSMETME